MSALLFQIPPYERSYMKKTHLSSVTVYSGSLSDKAAWKIIKKEGTQKSYNFYSNRFFLNITKYQQLKSSG